MPADRTRALPVVAICLALVLGACNGAKDKVERAATSGSTAPAAAETSTTGEPATTSSTAASSTTTTAAPAAAGPLFAVGSKGPEVKALEQRLADLKYDVGAVDGVYDSVTYQAVIAFQKVNGMPRTGKAGPDVLAALAKASVPGALLPSAEPFRVEIDLPRQVLFLYEGGQLVRTLAVSSGGGYRYCVDGRCSKAVTPGGSFRTTWRVSGKHTSRLGVLYNPVFFNGGIAVHGAPSVPTHPASHGCVRIPMSASRWFYDTVPKGFAVYVLGGARAPVPFNEPAPNGAPPADSGTTTTAAPATTVAPTTTTTIVPTTTSTTAPTTTTSSSSTTTSTTAAP